MKKLNRLLFCFLITLLLSGGLALNAMAIGDGPPGGAYFGTLAFEDTNGHTENCSAWWGKTEELVNGGQLTVEWSITCFIAGTGTWEYDGHITIPEEGFPYPWTCNIDEFSGYFCGYRQENRIDVIDADPDQAGWHHDGAFELFQVPGPPPYFGWQKKVRMTDFAQCDATYSYCFYLTGTLTQQL